DREEKYDSQEYPAPTDQVSHAPDQEHESSDSYQVRGDHPRDADLDEEEVTLDVRQRDVHDGRVEHDHQLAKTDHDQGHPPSKIRVHEYLQTNGPDKSRDANYNGIGMIPISWMIWDVWIVKSW